MFGAFPEVLGVGDVRDAIRLQHGQAFDQACVPLRRRRMLGRASA
jgi:hypothetical protein